MNILFLDDSKLRHQRIRQNVFGATLTAVYTAKGAIAQLDSNIEFDVILLDHDLSDEYEGQILDNVEDGRTVARYMAQTTKFLKTPIVIHSMNEPASKEMESILRNSGHELVTRLPCAWDRISVLGGKIWFKI